MKAARIFNGVSANFLGAGGYDRGCKLIACKPLKDVMKPNWVHPIENSTNHLSINISKLFVGVQTLIFNDILENGLSRFYF